MSKVLVTGAAGFIGGYLVEELLARGYTVVGLDNLSKYGTWARRVEDPRFTSVVGDAADKALLTELAQDCEHLIANAALIGGVGYMNAFPLDILIENNRLVDTAAQVGIELHRAGVLRKVTYVSSSMVYEHVEGGHIVEGNELTCPPPSTAYGFQKRAVEYVARAAWEQYGLPFTIVRPFNSVGAGERRTAYGDDRTRDVQPTAKGHVMPDFAERAIRRADPFPILGDGRQYRTFTYARDMATGIVLAMEKESALNEDFNLSGEQGRTVESLARFIWDKVNPGVPMNIRYEASYPHDVRVRRPDIGKAKRLLGFTPVTSMDTMVDEVIEWVRQEVVGVVRPGAPTA